MACRLAGWISDHVSNRKLVLAAGYILAAFTAILLAMSPHSLWPLAGIFAMAGIYEGTKESLEDSVAAE